MGESVSEAEVDELEEAIEEVETLLDAVQNWPDPNGSAEQAGAD